MKQITQNSVASLEYELTDTEGQILDTSKGKGPLAYIHGTGSLIPGLEEELEGKGEGDAFQVRIPPDKAYGDRDEGMVQEVPREQLPQDVEIEVGMQFQAQTEQGMHILTVVDVAAEAVKLDANHPLAGQTLQFEVKVVEVREATEEELEHGHVHGPGGHDH